MGLKIKGFAEIKQFGKGVMPSTCIFFSCHRVNSRSKLCYFQFKHQQTPPVPYHTSCFLSSPTPLIVHTPGSSRPPFHQNCPFLACNCKQDASGARETTHT